MVVELPLLLVLSLLLCGFVACVRGRREKRKMVVGLRQQEDEEGKQKNGVWVKGQLRNLTQTKQKGRPKNKAGELKPSLSDSK